MVGQLCGPLPAQQAGGGVGSENQEALAVGIGGGQLGQRVDGVARTSPAQLQVTDLDALDAHWPLPSPWPGGRWRQ